MHCHWPAAIAWRRGAVRRGRDTLTSNVRCIPVCMVYTVFFVSYSSYRIPWLLFTGLLPAAAQTLTNTYQSDCGMGRHARSTSGGDGAQAMARAYTSTSVLRLSFFFLLIKVSLLRHYVGSGSNCHLNQVNVYRTTTSTTLPFRTSPPMQNFNARGEPWRREIRTSRFAHRHREH